MQQSSDDPPIDGEDAHWGIWKWLAKRFIPTWCKSEDHWTVRLANELWIDCACCFGFRFAFLGFVIGAAFVALLHLLLEIF
jgi:hypothetical protein